MKRDLQVASCEGKAYFPSFERAAKKAKKHKIIGKPYHCKNCGGYHIGHSVGGKAYGKRPAADPKFDFDSQAEAEARGLD